MNKHTIVVKLPVIGFCVCTTTLGKGRVHKELALLYTEKEIEWIAVAESGTSDEAMLEWDRLPYTAEVLFEAVNSKRTSLDYLEARFKLAKK